MKTERPQPNDVAALNPARYQHPVIGPNRHQLQFGVPAGPKSGRRLDQHAERSDVDDLDEEAGADEGIA